MTSFGSELVSIEVSSSKASLVIEPLLSDRVLSTDKVRFKSINTAVNRKQGICRCQAKIITPVKEYGNRQMTSRPVS